MILHHAATVELEGLSEGYPSDALAAEEEVLAVPAHLRRDSGRLEP